MGAKIIYAARIIKDSGQEDHDSGEVVNHPCREEYGNLIKYCAKLPDKNSYHSRSIAVKAACTVCLGLKVIEGNETSVQERLAIVNENGESFTEVINKVALDFETCGNGWLECVRGKGGWVEELYFSPAIKTYRRPKGSSSPFLYMGASDRVEYQMFSVDERDPLSLIHFAQASPSDRHYGVPDWRGVIPEIDLDYYSTLYAKGFFLNSGIPDLAIVVEGGQFDQETEEKVVQFMREQFRGPGNAHRTLYLPVNDSEVKVRFEKLTPSNQWQYPIEAMRNNCRDRILSAHGVPPRMAGVVTAGQLGGGGEVESQLALFQEITISPRQKLFELRINRLLKAMGLKAKVEFEEIDTDKSEEPGKKWSSLYQAGIVDRKESRLALGLSAEIEGTEDPEKEEKVDNVALKKSMENLRMVL